MEKYDVVIVGAGIAGPALASLLAGEGIRVLLVEKNTYSGEKAACGGLFDKVYFDKYVSDPSIIEQVITINTFEVPWGPVDFNCEQVTVKRRNLDRRLTERARDSGTQLLTQTTVESYDVQEPGRVIVRVKQGIARESKEIECKIIAFADGPRSLSWQNENLNFENNRRYWAYAYAYEIEGAPKNPGEITIYFDPKVLPWGYSWNFPNELEMNVGAGTLVSLLGSPGALKKEFLRFVEEHHSSRAFPGDMKVVDKKGGYIPMWLNDRLSDVSQVVLGDAAGMVSPLFGAGIEYAFDAAELCAGVIVESLTNNNYSAEQLKKYDDAVAAGFGRELKKQMSLVKVILFSLKFGKSWPIKILSITAFGMRYSRWNKIKILLYPLCGRPKIKAG